MLSDSTGSYASPPVASIFGDQDLDDINVDGLRSGKSGVLARRWDV